MRPTLPQLTIDRPHVHPSKLSLERYLDRESPDAAPRRSVPVMHHVVRCRRCQNYVAWRQTVRASAQRLGKPTLVDSVSTISRSALDAALARRARGERILLPQYDVPNDGASSSHAGRIRRIGIGVAAVGALAVLLLSRGDHIAIAGGAEGELDITPRAPHQADTIIVTYRPRAEFMDAARLRLRTVFHPADDVTPWSRTAVTAAWLEKSRDGQFRGRFVLPAQAAYVRLAVEDSTASVVDARGNQPWEVLVHDENGAPRISAIRSRGLALGTEEWERSRDIARNATEVLPDHPSGWLMHTVYELEIADRANRQRTIESLVPRAVALDSTWRTRSAREPWAMLDLASIANMVGRAEDAKWWKRALLREAPHSRAAYSARTESLPMGAPDGNHVVLDSMERWFAIDPDSLTPFAQVVLTAALQQGDSLAVNRWADRVVAADSSIALPIARTLVSKPNMAATGVRIAQRAATRAHERRDGDRPLASRRRAWEQQAGDNERLAFTVVGEGLLTLGRPNEAKEILTGAAVGGWNARAYRLLGEAHLATGDTSAALDALAHAAADPIEGAPAELLATPFLRTEAQKSAWEATMAAARRAMHAHVLDLTTETPVLGHPRVWGEDGREVPLDSLTAHRVTLLAIVSRSCGPSLQDLPSLGRLSRALAAKPVRVFAMPREAMTDNLRAFWRQRGFSTPILLDREGEVARSLAVHSTPTYLLLDAKGRLRWRGHRAADASPIIDALLALGNGDKER